MTMFPGVRVIVPLGASTGRVRDAVKETLFHTGHNGAAERFMIDACLDPENTRWIAAGYVILEERREP